MTHDLMIDIETLGTRPGCVILSIGAVRFDPWSDKPILSDDQFHTLIRPDSCEAVGLRAEAGTALWWMLQSEQARQIARAFQGAVVPSLEVALDDLTEFVKTTIAGGCEAGVWCRGTSFDMPILRAAFEAVRSEVPWAYWQERDARTLAKLGGVEPPRQGVAHDALDDCLNQVHTVRANLRLLGLGR